jgi:hypothetical protein
MLGFSGETFRVLTKSPSFGGRRRRRNNYDASGFQTQGGKAIMITLKMITGITMIMFRMAELQRVQYFAMEVRKSHDQKEEHQ